MTVMDKWSSNNGIRQREDQAMDRAQTAQLAHQLSAVAIRQWEKAITGMVALPAAAALGVAATATYGVALLERGFEVFESAVGEVGRSMTDRRDGNEHASERTPEARA
jgi:hypothetical protein